MTISLSSRENEWNELAARATLLALRAALPRPGDVRLRLIFLLPEPAPMLEEDAVLALTALPKPVRVAAFPTHGALALATYPLEHDFDLAAHEHRYRTSARWYEDTYGVGARVQLRGYRCSLLLSLEALAAWQAQYSLLFVNSVGNVADSEARKAGAQAYLRFRAPSPPARDIVDLWGA